MVRLHYLFLAPTIVLEIPGEALLDLNIVVSSLVAFTGLAGSMFKRKRLTLLASVSLLSLLIWGKVAVDLLRVRSPDTAVFLFEFGMVLFFMEANLVVLTHDNLREELAMRKDEMSENLEICLRAWLGNQLSTQGKIAVGSLTLSILLLPAAGFLSISSGQLPFTGALLLLAVLAFLFLVTHRREPEKRE